MPTMIRRANAPAARVRASAERARREARRLQGAELFAQGVRPAEVARRLGVSRQSALRIDRLMVPGVGRIEEVDSQLLGWAADRGLQVELPQSGQAAGAFSFDAMLGDLASHADQTTARVTAKSIEYPIDQLELAGAGWPWRPTVLLALTVTAATGVALLPAAATRRNRR